jgi:hypothetical protein
MLTSFHLVRNPYVLKRLQAKIAHVPKIGNITRAQIQSLLFLRCCFNESMLITATL